MSIYRWVGGVLTSVAITAAAPTAALASISDSLWIKQINLDSSRSRAVQSVGRTGVFA